MLATMRAAAPRIGSPTGSAAAAAAAAAGAGARRGGAAPAPARAPAAAAAGAGGLGRGVALVVGEEVLPALAHRRRDRRGTARTSRRRARRSDRGRSGSSSCGGESSATAPSVPARASTTRPPRRRRPSATQPSAREAAHGSGSSTRRSDERRLAARPPHAGRAPRWRPTRPRPVEGTLLSCTTRSAWIVVGDVDHVVALPHLHGDPPVGSTPDGKSFAGLSIRASPVRRRGEVGTVPASERRRTRCPDSWPSSSTTPPRRRTTVSPEAVGGGHGRLQRVRRQRRRRRRDRRRRGPAAADDRGRHQGRAARAARSPAPTKPFAEAKEVVGGFYLLDCRRHRRGDHVGQPRSRARGCGRVVVQPCIDFGTEG